MKKYYYIIGLVSLLGISSCSSNFLDAESSDVITQEDIDDLKEKDPSAGLAIAKAKISGAYTLLFAPTWGTLQKSHDDFGLRAVYLAGDVMTDDIAIENGFLFNFDYQNDNRSLGYRRTKSTWSQLYAIIGASNDVVNLLEQTDETIELPAEVQLYLGQAYALRGYCYFVLINMFQQPYSVNKEAPGIPINTALESKMGRNTVKEVYELLLSDLFKAYKLLEGKGFKDAAQINEFSTAGMLARALCFVNDHPNQWKEVAKYADIAANGKPLMSGEDLTYGFNSVEKSEILWGSRINAETKTSYASFMSNVDPYADGYAGGGAYICIATELYNKIDRNDTRYKWFLEADEPIKDKEGVVTGYISKYTQVKFVDRGGFTSDYIYMRNAEMYLIKAEALFLSGDESGARTALETLVKTRLSSYSAASKTGNDLLEEIRIQKRIETWGEGSRLFDMKWRGEALNRKGSTNHVKQYTQELPANPKQWVYQIPQSEMDTNDEILENNP